jgi:hypothetical protein
MKNVIIVLLCLISALAFGQKEMKPTQSFVISGEVKAPVNVMVADLKKYKEVIIGDVPITNHMGEKKNDAKGLKGVLLKDVIQSAEINAESPKVLSEYYFVCKANDNYIVVFSWNELFNTATGDAAYVVTEKEGKPLTELKDAIQLICPRDYKTGRRSLYALASIEVKRAK